MTLSQWHEFSQIVYNILVGLSALATAGAYALIPEVKRLRKIRSFRRQYPPQSFGKTWELIGRRGIIYVHDLQLKLKRHVANPATMTDLGFDWNSVKGLSDAEFERIGLGSPIDTEKKR
jgi:hypothetical protein